MAMRLLYGLFVAVTCSAAVNAITYTQSHKVAEGQTSYSFSWATSGENATRKFHLRLEFDTDAVGWIGWGLGEEGSGGMAGADIVICTKDNGVWKVDDRYALGEQTPQSDAQQDWTLVSSSTWSTTVRSNAKLELERLMDTGDKQDRSIDHLNPMAVNMLFAHGPGAVGYHGATGRWRGKVSLVSGNEDAQIKSMTSAVDFGVAIDMLNPGYEIPTAENSFNTVKFEIAEDMQDRTIMGFSGVVKATDATGLLPKLAAARAIHHFGLKGMKQSDEGQESAEHIFSIGPGTPPMVFPPNVGIPSKNYNSIELETHYANPKNIAGLVDYSGLRFYLTKKGAKREHEYGVLQLGNGHPGGQEGEKVGNGLSKWTYSCPNLKATQDVTLFCHGFHMHQSGVKMSTEHYRNGKPLGGAKIEFYNSNYQDQIYRNEVAKTGDTFTTSCYFDTKGKDASFGPHSADNMCVDFVGYYPAGAIEPSNRYCGYEADADKVTSVMLKELGREFGSTGSAPAPSDVILCDDLPYPLRGLGLPEIYEDWSCTDYKSIYGGTCDADAIYLHPNCDERCKRNPGYINRAVNSRCPKSCGSCTPAPAGETPSQTDEDEDEDAAQRPRLFFGTGGLGPGQVVGRHRFEPLG